MPRFAEELNPKPADQLNDWPIRNFQAPLQTNLFYIHFLNISTNSTSYGRQNEKIIWKINKDFN